MQPKQGFATGVALREPAQGSDVLGAARSEVQPKQGFAAGVALPEPAQDSDVPAAARSEVQPRNQLRDRTDS
jgi:hypothetical protein